MTVYISIMDPLRMCRKCGTTRPVTDYVVRNKWRTWTCLDCVNAIERERYERRAGIGKRVIRVARVVVSLSPTDAAYLAGLVDGEGCVGYYPNRRLTRKSPMFSVVISNTNPLMKRWIEQKVGSGTWKSQTFSKTRKEIHWVSWYSAAAIALLRAIKPYLVLKQRQAQWMLGMWGMEERYLVSRNRCRFSKYCPVPSDIEFQRIATASAMRELNRRGSAA